MSLGLTAAWNCRCWCQCYQVLGSFALLLYWSCSLVLLDWSLSLVALIGLQLYTRHVFGFDNIQDSTLLVSLSSSVGYSWSSWCSSSLLMVLDDGDGAQVPCSAGLVPYLFFCSYLFPLPFLSSLVTRLRHFPFPGILSR